MNQIKFCNCCTVWLEQTFDSIKKDRVSHMAYPVCNPRCSLWNLQKPSTAHNRMPASLSLEFAYQNFERAKHLSDHRISSLVQTGTR